MGCGSCFQCINQRNFLQAVEMDSVFIREFHPFWNGLRARSGKRITIREIIFYFSFYRVPKQSTFLITTTNAWIETVCVRRISY